MDEVTQYEFVGAVAGISERFLLPLLEGLLLSFPFRILGFHADNGSEYINHRVAELLEKLRVERFTKSRARTSNDNALVEGKNERRAQVVRSRPLPQRFAPDVSRFAHGTLSPFLNFHRPCLFATEYRDDAGKVRRKYLARDVMTPYARFRSTNAQVYLKPGMDFALLDAAAAAETDLHAARRVQTERRARSCALPPAWPRRAPPDERRVRTPCRSPAPGASPRTPALAGRQGSAVGWLAGKECSPPPGTHPRSAATTADPCLPGYSPVRRVKGPLRRPRRLARTRRRHQATPLRQPRRRARVALALDPDHLASQLHGSDHFTLTFSLDNGAWGRLVGSRPSLNE